jgi:hypothetical protein
MKGICIFLVLTKSCAFAFVLTAVFVFQGYRKEFDPSVTVISSNVSVISLVSWLVQHCYNRRCITDAPINYRLLTYAGNVIFFISNGIFDSARLLSDKKLR